MERKGYGFQPWEGRCLVSYIKHERLCLTTGHERRLNGSINSKSPRAFVGHLTALPAQGGPDVVCYNRTTEGNFICQFVTACKFPDRLQYKTYKTVLMDPSGHEYLECQTKMAERSLTALLPTNMATSIYRENLLASSIRNIEF